LRRLKPRPLCRVLVKHHELAVDRDVGICGNLRKQGSMVFRRPLA
jgi:hypothetical protein